MTCVTMNLRSYGDRPGFGTRLFHNVKYGYVPVIEVTGGGLLGVLRATA